MSRIGNLAFSNQSAGEQQGSRQKGFLAEDVSSFLNQGNNQARGGSPTAPKLTQTNVVGGKQVGADLNLSSQVTSQGQVDLLVKSFTQRKQSINQKRAQPSRSGLFLGGN